MGAAGANHVIERGDTYDHDRYGVIETTVIRKGVDGVDSTRQSNENETYIVRYATEENGEHMDKLTDTLDEFLEATQ
ncbi:hypothetical protein [Natronosalvus halobius]|uniref:hypothetical protein n=1 Tax=Natronosalvus halobius TaxID=2953746 RepID=UPI00209F5D3E|nr:hypothetical protein [Natronosalvus halobius]USZ71416.1 hypothetical protein NGM15_15255 [Natronosalvus halobius]